MSIKKNKKIIFAGRLKKLRNYKNITLKKLAEELKIKSNTIHNYEFDDYIPPIDTFIKFLNFFNFSADFFLANKNYINNIKLFKLCEIIDKMPSTERSKIETTIETFLKKNIQDNKSQFDTRDIILKNDVHENVKILREKNEISQRELSRILEKSPTVVRQYESGKNNPSPENLIKLSNFFNVSIHFLITGEKLFFYFKNESFKKIVLKADKQLSLEQHKFIIELMEALINNN